MAPSGVLVIGAALVLRDLVQSELGPWSLDILVDASGEARLARTTRPDT
jgi:hypothetical protein